MQNKYAKRKDSTQSVIVETLESAGCWTLDTSWVGRGFPDVLAVFNGVLYLVECKDRRGTLTEPEQRFIESIPYPVHIIRTPEEALAMIGR